MAENEIPFPSAYDPSKLSEFEHERLVKLFKQKAAVAYLISVGCTTHHSLNEMIKYVLENEEPPHFRKPNSDKFCKAKNSEKTKKKKHGATENKTDLPVIGYPVENADDDNRNFSLMDGIPIQSSLSNEAVTRKLRLPIEVHLAPPSISAKGSKFLRKGASEFYSFAKSAPIQKRLMGLYLRNNKTKTVVKKEKPVEALKTKVLLPPLDDEGRTRFLEKVRRYFHVDIDQRKLVTEREKERKKYADKRRKQDAEWRKYVNAWGLYFPYSGMLPQRHQTIKKLENAHLAPGMYHASEYEEIQRSKKLQIQRGFDNGIPRFLVKDEFSHITPVSYGDGVYKFEKYMKNTGIVKYSNLPQAERFPYKGQNCNPPAYGIQSSVDALLKSEKGVLYPKLPIPYNKRRSRCYIASGYNATPQKIKPKPMSTKNILKSTLQDIENSAKKPKSGMVSDLIQLPRNQYKGKFPKPTPHFIEKHVEVTPGPGSYNIAKEPSMHLTKGEIKRKEDREKLKKKQKAKEDMFSVDYMPTQDFYVLAEPYNSEDLGPGKYNIAGSLTKQSGFPGRFKEGVPQRLSLRQFNTFGERIQAINIPQAEKLALANR